MSWFAICDTLPFHKKILRAGNEAVGAWARMGAWCAKYLTDGLIPSEAVALITQQPVVDRLVEVGLLERAGDGFALHDYLEYNPTAEEAEAQRTKKHDLKVDSGRLGGIASGISRRRTGSKREAPSHSPTHAPTQKETDLFPSGPANGPLTARASDLLHELNASRMLNIEGARKISPTARTLQHIVARLSDGHTEDDVRHVIAVCAQEVRENPDSERWFNHETPFRPDNFARKLAMTVRAGRRVTQGQHRDRRPEDVEREEQEHRERMRREREEENGR